MEAQCRGGSVGHQRLVVGRDGVGGEREEGKEVVEGEADGQKPGQPEAGVDAV